MIVLVQDVLLWAPGRPISFEAETKQELCLKTVRVIWSIIFSYYVGAFMSCAPAFVGICEVGIQHH